MYINCDQLNINHDFTLIDINGFCLLHFLTGCNDITCFDRCQNGGECLSGQCICDEGYTGPSCSEEMTPVNILVKYIRLLSLGPNMDSNGMVVPWDSSSRPESAPDLYFKFFSDSTLIFESGVEQNIGENYWNYALANYSLFPLKPDSSYVIELWDYDEGELDDLVGKADFQLDSWHGFPDTFEVVRGEYKWLRLHVRYEFE